MSDANSGATVATTSGAVGLTGTTGVRFVHANEIVKRPGAGVRTTRTGTVRGIGDGPRRILNASVRLIAARASAPGTAWTWKTTRPCAEARRAGAQSAGDGQGLWWITHTIADAVFMQYVACSVSPVTLVSGCSATAPTFSSEGPGMSGRLGNAGGDPQRHLQQVGRHGASRPRPQPLTAG